MRALTCNDIYIHNDFFDMVSEHPENYDPNLIFNICCETIVHRTKLISYLFKKAILTNNECLFQLKIELMDCNIYDEYIQNIIKSNDDFIKICLILYFEYGMKDMLFNNVMEMINAIINSPEEANLKLTNLLNISQFKCDEDTYEYLKSNFKKILFEYNKDAEVNEVNKILNNYYDFMDTNQINLGNSKILEKKK